jgi:hypothetical protein
LTTSIAVTTVDALAFGLGFVAVACADRRRIGLATIAFALAGLTRESGAVMAIATAAALLPRLRWRAVPIGVVPPALLLGWYVALGQFVGGQLPERAAFLAIRDVDSAAIVVGIVTWMMCVVAAVHWRDVPVISTIAGVFAVWTIFYSAGIYEFAQIGVFRVNSAIAALGLSALLPRRRAARRPQTRRLYVSSKQELAGVVGPGSLVGGESKR